MYTKSKEERIQGDERAAVMESRETRAQSHTRSEDNGDYSVFIFLPTLLESQIISIYV